MTTTDRGPMMMRADILNIEVQQYISSRVERLLEDNDLDWRWLSEYMGMTTDVLYRRKRGATRWTVADVYQVAFLFQVPLSDIFPSKPDVLRAMGG